MASTVDTAAPPATPSTPGKFAYLIGNPIAHSLSPLMQNKIYATLPLPEPHSYVLNETADLLSALPLLRAPSTFGAAITMPYKVAIIPHLDTLTPQGRAIGAINTVVFTPSPSDPTTRVLTGTNTDCIGIGEGIRRNCSAAQYAAMRGKPALIIGGGGTSRAAVYALKTFIGASQIYMLNRDDSEVAAVLAECAASGLSDAACPVTHIATLEQARAVIPPAVIVSAIPDFAPKTPAEQLVREMAGLLLDRGRDVAGPEGAVLLEMCYHPSSKTQITALAKGKGWSVVPGTEAMIWQGLEQVRLWTGREVEDMDVEGAKAVVKEALARH